ncbi:hypothetical protein [Paenibacillus sp. Z6-24]
MSNEFDNNRDAAAQEYNRYRTIDPVTARDEEELRSIPADDLDLINPTVRDEEGIQPVASEHTAVKDLDPRLSSEDIDLHRHTIDLDTNAEELDTGTNVVDQGIMDNAQNDSMVDDGSLPDIPDADELNGGETPEDPSVPSSYDQDAHGTDLRNGSTGEDDPDRFERRDR